MARNYTTVFIPFNIKESNELALEPYIKILKKALNTRYPITNVSFYDPHYYVNHINNIISYEEKKEKHKKEKANFLTVYNITDNNDLQKLELIKTTKEKKEKLKDNFQNANKLERFYYNRNRYDIEIDDSFNLEFTKNNFIIINNYSNIGFFVFTFEVKGKKDQLGIKEFSNCVFFRFINEGERKENKNNPYKLKVYNKENIDLKIKDNQLIFEYDSCNPVVLDPDVKEAKIEPKYKNNIYKLKIEKDGITLEDEKGILINKWTNFTKAKSNEGTLTKEPIFFFNINDIINTYKDKVFENKLKDLIEINYKKPFLLHLFNEIIPQNGRNQFKNLLYKTLRINSENYEIDENEDLRENYFSTSSGILGCVSVEGASIIDYSYKRTSKDSKTENNLQSLFNKYFTEYILILNQREVMIRFNEKISELSYEDLNKISKETEKKLMKHKKEMELFKFRQIIYSFSLNDELSLLQNKLIHFFQIDNLLKDNQESLNELNSILKMEKEEYEKSIIDMIGLILGVASLVSLAIDFNDLFLKDDYTNNYKYISAFLIIIGFLFILITLKFRKLLNKIKLKIYRFTFYIKNKIYLFNK